MKKKVPDSDQFTHVLHQDLMPEEIERRTSLLFKHARAAGAWRPGFCRSGPDRLCQTAAAELRTKEEVRTLAQLRRRDRKGDQLLALTLVFTYEHGLQESKFLTKNRASRLTAILRDAMGNQPDITMIAGCIEVDRCHKDQEAFWQYTAHLVVAVSAVRWSRAAKVVRAAFPLKPSIRVKRPVMIREMDDPRGWVRYCYKTLQYGAVMRRCTYDSKPRSKTTQRSTRTVRLLPVERNALVIHLAKRGVERQLIRLRRSAQ